MGPVMRAGGRAGRTGRLLGACALAAALGGALPGLAAAQDAPPGVGDHAPAIELPDCQGKTRRVAWDEGGPAATVVFFFDPQSRDSLQELAFLDVLHLAARDFGLAVHAIEARGRQPAEVSRSLERYCSVYREPSFPVLPDPSFRAGRVYGVREVPTTLLTESHGIVLDRVEGYGPATAVAVTRRVERLLRRDRGFFSRALRDAGIDEDEERAIEARAAAAAAQAGDAGGARSLAPGDRAPEFEYADPAGRGGRWQWGGAGGGARIAFFFGGTALASIEEMSWLAELARRGSDVGLEVLAVESSGLDAAALQAAMERYRRVNPAPPFPVVADPGGRIGKLFGVGEGLPRTFVVGSDGVIIYRADGFDRGEGEAIAGRVERAFQRAGRPFPAARGRAAAEEPAPSAGEEAPSVKARREQEERYRSGIVQGDAAFMAWEFPKALPFYLQALEVQPKDLHALVRAAQIYERRGEPDLAYEYWERVLAVRPDHTEARARAAALRPAR